MTMGAVTLIPSYGRAFVEFLKRSAYALRLHYEVVPEGYEFNGGWKLTTDLNKVINNVNLVNNYYYGDLDEYGNQPPSEFAEESLLFTKHDPPACLF